MIVNGHTQQAKRRALEKFSHQISAGNGKRCDDNVRLPAGVRQ